MEGWATVFFRLATFHRSKENIVKLMEEDKIRNYLKKQADEIFNKAKKDPEYANCKLREDDADFEIFRFSKQLEVLWQLLIEKSIKALRYYDGREPFKDNPAKKPKVYFLPLAHCCFSPGSTK